MCDQDHQNRSGLGIYIWEDGANFEFVVNQETGNGFPYGMDPSVTNDELGKAGNNQTVPAELTVGNSSAGFVGGSSSV